MARPTIALRLIAKNEAHNLPRLMKSVEGCFDEIWLTDTGSNDETILTFQKLGVEHLAKYGTKFFVRHFVWIKDFSAARNFALDEIKTDFWMWMDLDDSLENPEGFNLWRDNAMEFHDYWLANYHYALDEKEKPLITFSRERVFRTSLGFRFNYFIHEGVGNPGVQMKTQFAVNWAVKHHRTAEDLAKDKGRNLDILESNKERLDSRMTFYYGKELYENQRFEEAVKALLDAITRGDLAPHDRIMGYQYAALAALAHAHQLKPEFQGEKIVKVIELCHLGLRLDSTRAEFFCILGDALIMAGRMHEAVPYLEAAKALENRSKTPTHATPNHRETSFYTWYPRVQLSKIYFHIGAIDKAEREANDCLEFYPHVNEAKIVAQEIKRLTPLVDLKGPKKKVDDIVITCPPQGAYEWDSLLYQTKGMGGSETAAIEVSQWLRIHTKRPVKIFNMRKDYFKDTHGVEYFPTSQLNEYFAEHEPELHIAWRHNIKVTDARTYLWCHDLVTQSVEAQQNFDKILCLTEFHKRYVMAMQGVPKDKVIVWRNGIDPQRFERLHQVAKNENKVVWMSSPDRGLDACMLVMDELRKTHPNLELHVYYGLENLFKYGLADLAKKLEGMMAERPWVKYHGFTEQKKMTSDVADAVLWLHPCNFIETFCITALECLSNRIYPVTRRLGALQDTLREAEAKGMAKMLDHPCETEDQIRAYAEAAREVLDKKLWQNIQVDPKEFSWENVTNDLINFAKL